MAYTISTSLEPTTAAYVADDNSLKGGYRIVNSIADRDNIIFTRLKQGMLVYTIQDDVVWKLHTLTPNPDDPATPTKKWIRFGSKLLINATTTDTTKTSLNVTTQANPGLITYDITVAAISSSNQSAYRLEGGVLFDGTNSTLLGGRKIILVETLGAQDWNVDISANAGLLMVDITGSPTDTVKWMVSADTTEVLA